MEPSGSHAWRIGLITRRNFFVLLVIVTPLVIAACSSTSSTLGQYHEGRILILNVMQIERADELRYSTIDPEQEIRKWRIQPSKDGNELVLMRIKVQNNVAVKAVFEADGQAAVLRDFFQNDYRPLSVSDTVYLDRRGQGDTTVTLEDGVCSDHTKTVVNAGSEVRWTNTGETASALQFAPGTIPEMGDEPIMVAPGDSLSHRFEQPGAFTYRCSTNGEEPSMLAQILVEDSSSVRKQQETNILFLEGPFELLKDTAVDGWMIFEVPEGTKLRDLRWRAGDSITVRF